MKAIQLAALAASFFVSACATSSAGLLATRVEKTVESTKTPAAFATCFAEAVQGDAELRNDGDHYWVLRMVMGVPRHRWDFTPTATGSKAELRSTGLAGAGEDKLRACA